MERETRRREKPHPQDDCLTCKVIGTVTFTSISGYALYLRLNTPKHDKGAKINLYNNLSLLHLQKMF